MCILGWPERSAHAPIVIRVLILALLQGAMLLHAGPVQVTLIAGDATGFFGGVEIAGWFDSIHDTSSITVSGAPNSVYQYTYTFTGPLNFAGYTQTSQIPPTPCIILGCIPSLPGHAGLRVSPVNGVTASLGFEDTGELFTGSGTLASAPFFTDTQGGSSSSPTFLINEGPVAGVSGTISGAAPDDYFRFEWSGGAFSATGSVSGAAADATFLFSEGLTGNCASGGSSTLNSGDNFTGTIHVANLAAGEYCIGMHANSGTDPVFTLTFNTPVTGSSAPSSAPEPSSFALFSIGSLILGKRLFVQRRR